KKIDMEVQALPSSPSMMVTVQPNNEATRQVQERTLQTMFYVTMREKNLDKLTDAVRRLAEAVVENGGTAADRDHMEVYSRRNRIMMRGMAAMGQAQEEPEHVGGPSIEWIATVSADARREVI